MLRIAILKYTGLSRVCGGDPVTTLDKAVYVGSFPRMRG